MESPCFDQESLPGRGEDNAMRRAVKELDAEVCLQLMHRTAQRRLGHVEPCCCTADVAFLGHRDEVPEPAQVHTPDDTA